MPRIAIPESRLFRAVCVAGIAYLAFYALVVVFRGPESYLTFHSNVLYNLPGLAAIFLAPVAMRNARGRERWGWFSLAVMLACWQAADWSYALYVYVLEREVPVPSYLDVFYYVGYIAFAVGVFLIAVPPGMRAHRGAALDMLIVMTAASLLIWEFALAPALSAGDSAAATATAAGYVVLDLALLATLVGAHYAGGGRSSPRLTLLAAAVLAQVSADIVYAEAVRNGYLDYSANVMELGWVAAYVLIAVAFVYPERPRRVVAVRRSSVADALPYLCVLPLVAVAFGVAGAPSQAMTAGTVVVMGLVLARQALMQREHRDLVQVREREAQTRLALLQAQSDLGEILVTIHRGRFASVNEAAAAVTGYSVDELMAMESIVPLIPEEERDTTFTWIGERASGSSEAASAETVILRKDGSRMNLELSAMPMVVDGEMHLLIVGRDVTARREAEAQARARDTEIAAILGSIPDMVTRLRRDGTYTFFKAPHGLDIGFVAEEMLGRNMRDVIPPAFADAAIATIEKTLDSGEPQSFEFVSPTTSEPRHFEGIMSVCDEDEVVAVMRDITMRKRTEQALREAVAALNESKGQLEQKSQLLEAALNAEREHARRDSLTGALNHGAITATLTSLIEQSAGRPSAVIMIDVNGMKATNDTYGHQVGDAVLMEVANALSRNLALVGRYGGDEFVAILPGADRAMAEEYRDDVLDVIAATQITDPESSARVPMNVSIGIAIYPEEAETVADLIRLSDEAMYAAKRERPINEGGFESIRPLADERASKMVGELVPLLTSPGDLQDKLRLVGHKLSIGAGYDGVNIVFTQQGRNERDANAFARVRQDLLEAWNETQRHVDQSHPANEILERTRRPIILHDLAHDAGITASERTMLIGMGLKSALIAPMFWQGQLVGALSVGSRRSDAFGPPDAAFLMGVATQVTAIVQLAGLVEDLQAASERLAASQAETVMMLAAAAEAHDRTTGMHLRSIRELAEALARELGYNDRAVSDLGLAAVLHDIGKVSVPDAVLGTPGKLDPQEWEQMKAHTIWGGDFLSGRPGFDLAARVARSHHERWDGGGYPDGLRGEEIPEAAAIVTVADSFDAMTHDRPYKARLSVSAAIAELRACAGTQFSPRVVAALLALHERGELPHHDAGTTTDEGQLAA